MVYVSTDDYYLWIRCDKNKRTQMYVNQECVDWLKEVYFNKEEGVRWLKENYFKRDYLKELEEYKWGLEIRKNNVKVKTH